MALARRERVNIMLTGVTLKASAWDAEDRYLAALSGAAFLSNGDLIVASAGENAVTRLGGDLATLQQQRFAHLGLHHIATDGDEATVLARWGAGITVTGSTIAQDAAANLTAASGDATATRGIGGIELGGTRIADTDAAPLGDVTALATLSDGRVIAGSAFDSGIALIGTDAILDDVALAEDGFWHSRVSAIETVSAYGTDYAIVAASGSSSLSVFEVSGDELILTDHQWDNMMTRFSGVSELAVAQVQGTTVIAAAGNDAGVALFALETDGTLTHLGDILDTEEAAIGDVGGLALRETIGGAELVTASEDEHGLSLFELEFDFIDEETPVADPEPELPPFQEAVSGLAPMPMLAPQARSSAQARDTAPETAPEPVIDLDDPREMATELMNMDMMLF
ncbi:hypothetical protein [Roseobacter sp. HKCCA0434]|uniref:hypothetical protein n=1 Tax=Roseobacter sp. HKCCA0434 TaxID=3079297 RepID=UPI002905EAF5|nr:hypothetical protein [Roseobacter sp. HKCCA0434]